jgi:hypothetical protein
MLTLRSLFLGVGYTIDRHLRRQGEEDTIDNYQNETRQRDDLFFIISIEGSNRNEVTDRVSSDGWIESMGG